MSNYNYGVSVQNVEMQILQDAAIEHWRIGKFHYFWTIYLFLNGAYSAIFSNFGYSYLEKYSKLFEVMQTRDQH